MKIKVLIPQVLTLFLIVFIVPSALCVKNEVTSSKSAAILTRTKSFVPSFKRAKTSSTLTRSKSEKISKKPPEIINPPNSAKKELIDTNDFKTTMIKHVTTETKKKIIQYILAFRQQNIFQEQTPKLFKTEEFTLRVHCIAINHQGTKVALGSKNKLILFDLSSKTRYRAQYPHHSKAIRCMDFSPTEDKVVTGSLDSTLKLWDTKKGYLLHTLKGHTKKINSVIFSSDGKYIASGSDDQLIKIWDVNSGTCIQTLDRHKTAIESVVFSIDGKQLISVSYGKTVRIWDINTGKCLHIFTGATEYINFNSFYPQVIIQPSHLKTLINCGLYDETDQEAIKILENPEDKLTENQKTLLYVLDMRQILGETKVREMLQEKNRRKTIITELPMEMNFFPPPETKLIAAFKTLPPALKQVVINYFMIDDGN